MWWTALSPPTVRSSGFLGGFFWVICIRGEDPVSGVLVSGVGRGGFLWVDLEFLMGQLGFGSCGFVG